MRFRCESAAAVALITHPQFCTLAWVQEKARKYARLLFEKDGDAEGLLDLPPAKARELLLPAIPRIIKTQKRDGYWRTKNARAISYTLLKALARTELQDNVLPQLRHDPYQAFRDADDWYGIAVRTQLLHASRADEQAVQQRVLQEIAGGQQYDGSWEHTVMGSVHHLAMLAEAGLTASPCFQRGIDYLFACIETDVRHLHSGQVVAHNMITAEPRESEFGSTLAHKPHWLPHIACHSHLPLVQTGCALRLLNKTGYADDPRVLQACRNLVAMYERFGGWCTTNIHRGLLAENKTSKGR